MFATETSRASVIGEWLPKLCEALLRVDPEIVAIVQFGSSIYAPNLALDLDLLVVTREKKASEVYWDAVWSSEQPFWVDLVVVELGEQSGFLGAAVRAFGRLLFGDLNAVLKVTKNMPIPTFDEAKEILDEAEKYLQDARNDQTPTRREIHYRNAFNSLFDAARLTAKAFLLTEETRWGILANRLTDPFDQRLCSIG